MAAFVAKVTTARDAGVHVVVLDVLPAGRFDPAGLPGAVWADVGNGGYQLPAAKRLTCASFIARPAYEVYADHLAPGDLLPATPLFLTAGEYVPLPLGPTYLAAFDSIPEHHRNVLTAAPT